MLHDNRDNTIARLRFRIGAVMAIRECLKLFFAWLMIWAVAVVGLRAVFGIDSVVLLWGILGLVPAAAVGVILAARRIPSHATTRAVLDKHGCLGGLLMAAGDTNIGQWRNRIESVPRLDVRWHSGRQWMLLLTSAGFLTAALLAPDRYLPAGDENALQIGGEVEKLTDKIAVMKKERVISPEKAETLEKDLECIRREALGEDPAKTLEAIDHLEHSLSKAAADAAELLIKQTEKTSQARELAGALGAAEDQMDAKQFGEAMNELSKMIQEAADENELLSENLSDELREALDGGNLSDEQFRELCEALEGCMGCQMERMQQLVEARLVDPESLELCEGAGEFDEGELLAMLCECEGGEQFAELLACLQTPGRGGVSRGRADAVMTWQDAVEKGDAAFKEQVLPPADVSAMKKSKLSGISAGAPKPAAGGESSGGALGSAQAGGGEARTQTILPEHKNTVKRYFERDKK